MCSCRFLLCSKNDRNSCEQGARGFLVQESREFGSDFFRVEYRRAAKISSRTNDLFPRTINSHITIRRQCEDVEESSSAGAKNQRPYFSSLEEELPVGGDPPAPWRKNSPVRSHPQRNRRIVRRIPLTKTCLDKKLPFSRTPRPRESAGARPATEHSEDG